MHKALDSIPAWGKSKTKPHLIQKHEYIKLKREDLFYRVQRVGELQPVPHSSAQWHPGAPGSQKEPFGEFWR